MRCVDVNVLVDAHRPESPRHGDVREWLDAARMGPEPLGVPSIVASGFLRVVTHSRVFTEPTPAHVALDFTESLYRSPAVSRVEPGERHWSIFSRLVETMDLRGNRIPDAYLAAIPMELGSTWVTSDRGFRSFDALRVVEPGH